MNDFEYDEDDVYELQELIERLEIIRHQGEGGLSYAKAIYCLAKEIEKIQKMMVEIFK